MIHEILPVGLLACNCSVFGDETTREALIVDPGDNVDEILAIVRRHGLRVTAIVITHAHLDHLGGAAQLKAATAAPVYMNSADLDLSRTLETQAAWLAVPAPAPPAIDLEARDGDVLKLGADEFHVLHTPGHTQGSICLWAPAHHKLLAGDTLFRESIGRTDLPGGDPRRILVSIRDKLLVLPEQTLVIPGHGPQTTLAHEKRFNYFLQRL